MTRPSETSGFRSTLPEHSDIGALAELLATEGLFVNLTYCDGHEWFCELRNKFLGHFPHGSAMTPDDAIRAAHASALYSIAQTR